MGSVEGEGEGWDSGDDRLVLRLSLKGEAARRAGEGYACVASSVVADAIPKRSALGNACIVATRSSSQLLPSPSFNPLHRCKVRVVALSNASLGDKNETPTHC